MVWCWLTANTPVCVVCRIVAVAMGQAAGLGYAGASVSGWQMLWGDTKPGASMVLQSRAHDGGVPWMVPLLRGWGSGERASDAVWYECEVHQSSLWSDRPRR